MGTIPSDSELGGTVQPEKEASEFRAAPSVGNFQPGLVQEEWAGPPPEEDGGEGKGLGTGPAADDPSGGEGEGQEEEPHSTPTVWHPKGSLGQLGVEAGGSPVTEEACGPAGLAALGQGGEGESRPPGNVPRLPLGQEGREGVCLLGRRAVGRSCCMEAEGPLGGEEQECPICTELYDRDRHPPALLNCSHVLCGQCLQAILQAGSAADIGLVQCPVCRQTTPMVEWEICKLQEELLLLTAAQGPAPPAFIPLPARQPGFWGRLEHHFRVRFHTSRVVGFFPCLRYPACLVGGLAELERRCRWGYRAALLALAAAEMLSLLLVFLPILLLLLLFLILEQ